MSENNSNRYVCSICAVEKDINEFYKNKATKSGLKDNICKKCHKDRDNLSRKEKHDSLVEAKESDMITPLNDFGELYKDIDEGLTMAVFGASRSGKTTFLVHLYEKIYMNYDIKIMITPNYHKPIYKNFTKHHGILIPEFNDKLIKMLHQLNVKTNNHFRILLMIDDVVDEKHSDELKKCILTYRNANISTVISLQGHTLLNKNSRGNIHRFVFLKLNTNEEIQEIVERMITGMIKVPASITRIHDRIEYLKNWYINHTLDYNMFVIDGLDKFKLYKFKTPV